jgi:hypothetical protein
MINDYCIYIDEGFNDRKYFILDADCSFAIKALWKDSNKQIGH